MTEPTAGAGGLAQRLLGRLGRGRHGGELLRGSGVALAFRLVGMATTYVFNFLVARWFGASAVGALALATTVVTIAATIGRLGLDRAIVKFVAGSVSRGATGLAAAYAWNGLAIVAGLGLGLSVVLWFLAPWLASTAFEKPETAEYFRVAAPAVLFFSLSLYMAETLRGLKRILEFTVLRFVLVYAVACAAVTTMYLSGGADAGRAAVSAFVVGCAAAAAVGLPLLLRRLPDRGGVAAAVGPLLVVSLPMLVSNSMGMVVQWTDVLMLGRFVSQAELGVYSIALKLAFAGAVLLNAVNAISTPKFAEIHHGQDAHELGPFVRQTTRLLMIGSLPVFVVLVLFGKPVLGLFGDEFRAGYAALVVLATGQLVSSVSGPVGNLLQMTGLERWFLAIVTVAGLLNVGMNLVLIPRFGIEGAAVASAVALAVNNGLCVLLIRGKLGFWSIWLPGIGRARRPAR